MVRTRGVDRSKRQKTRGTSSPPRRLIPSGPGQSSAAAPPPPHPLSQFGSGEQRERYQVLSTLPIHPNYIFRVEELNKIGLGESVMHIIRTSKWDRFVQNWGTFIQWTASRIFGNLFYGQTASNILRQAKCGPVSTRGQQIPVITHRFQYPLWLLHTWLHHQSRVPTVLIWLR